MHDLTLTPNAKGDHVPGTVKFPEISLTFCDTFPQVDVTHITRSNSLHYKRLEFTSE